MLTSPSVLRAQSVADLEQRVARLELQRQHEIELLEGRMVVDDVQLDTVRMGQLTIMGTAADLGHISHGLPQAWHQLSDLLGSDATMLGQVPLVVTRDEVRLPTRSNLPPMWQHLLRVMGSRQTYEEPTLIGYSLAFTAFPAGNMVANVRTSLDPDADELAGALTQAAVTAIGQLVPRDVRDWAGSSGLLSRTVATPVAYRYVLTGTVSTGLECLAGDLVQCRDGLGLSPARDGISPGYDIEDLQQVVAHYDGGANGNPRLAREYASCVGDSLITACREFLRGRYGDWLEPPFDRTNRRLVLAVAIDLGGDGAVGRLVRSDGSLSQRLEFVAGAPLDTVIERWRTMVVDAAGHSVQLSSVSAVFALVWFLFFGLLALRNAQWR